MLDNILQLAGLPQTTLLLLVGTALLAGLVRGFSGFGMSAVIMAGMAAFIPPVQLIPVCFTVEVMASLVMFRGGIKHANMSVVWGLFAGAMVGVPVGLLAITSMDPSMSKRIALGIIIVLALSQLARLRPQFLATRPGLYASGFAAGIANGLASVGGMVVALYVLASNANAQRMRASLVMYLFLSMFTSLVFLLAYDILTIQAIYRAMILAPFILIGIWIGSRLFNPEKTASYRFFCLSLLIVLSVTGIMIELLGSIRP